jgi:hypothetical protein
MPGPDRLEPTVKQILDDFVRDQLESINACKLSLKHSFVAPYFAKFPLFCDRIEVPFLLFIFLFI